MITTNNPIGTRLNHQTRCRRQGSICNRIQLLGNFVCDNPMQGYVRAIALPKVEKTRKAFKDLLKKESPLDRE